MCMLGYGGICWLEFEMALLHTINYESVFFRDSQRIMGLFKSKFQQALEVTKYPTLCPFGGGASAVVLPLCTLFWGTNNNSVSS